MDFKFEKGYIKKTKEGLFDVTNEGLHYKDCYITYNENSDETIVLLFGHVAWFHAPKMSSQAKVCRN